MPHMQIQQTNAAEVAEAMPETKLYRLTAKAQMHGEVRQPGYIFTLPDGEPGPHKTAHASQVDGDWRRGWQEFPDGARDEPLYEEVVDKPTVAKEPATAEDFAAELEAARGRGGTLRRELVETQTRLDAVNRKIAAVINALKPPNPPQRDSGPYLPM
ncbi:MAG: hypothetical protein KGL35_21920 [Bradyrhizobium sp.]|uniref:hypothetical protein n=1 Tax=Bradyrhizobium sp. TaxID=376 RepID=UPI001C29AE80|nr:hypothetical protein [Bradyrhizobium sp.]MBU6463235.1 hypothetical protein [Pseudomonadota bacterium]MDE2068105.1 hypothetical protein [Bradyrhizobium sp.]MDE2471314.1 hypothetical protein [Bradyrhizobium sp.]